MVARSAPSLIRNYSLETPPNSLFLGIVIIQCFDHRSFAFAHNAVFKNVIFWVLQDLIICTVEDALNKKL
jgi:hypothetical protein